MVKRTKKSGRPNEIGAKTVIAAYNLTAKQKAWLKRQGKLKGVSASDILRELLENVMEQSA